MTWQAAKAGFSLGTGPSAWRRLGQTLALLLLLSQQAWAGLICHCSDDAAPMSHACCLSTHHDVSVDEARQTSPAETTCAEQVEAAAELLPADNPCGGAALLLRVCCQTAPPLEPPALASAREPLPVFGNQPLILNEESIAPATAYDNHHHPNCTRSLYLAFACLLI